MTNYDWVGHNFFEPAIAPAGARAANFTGGAIDCLNCEGQMGLFLTGTLTATAVVSLEESDDNSTWTALAAPAVTNMTNQLPLNLAINATLDTYGVNFTRSKRYVRVVITGTGHTLAGHVMGHAKYVPA